MTSVFVWSVIIAFLGCAHGRLSDEYQNSVQLDDLNKKYMLYWSHNSSEEMMYFAVQVKTIGWVAMGFAEKIGNMKDYDVVISYVLPEKPSTEIHDYFTNGHKVPPVDSLQNYYLLGSSEVDGTTTIRFKRLVDTKDSLNDLVIK
ncbi:hypothetical protein QZH41_017031, partial [Actinostola sp. cb2023]